MVSGTVISAFKDASSAVSFLRLAAEEETRIEELAKELKKILDTAKSRSS